MKVSTGGRGIIRILLGRANFASSLDLVNVEMGSLVLLCRCSRQETNIVTYDLHMHYNSNHHLSCLLQKASKVGGAIVTTYMLS